MKSTINSLKGFMISIPFGKGICFWLSQKNNPIFSFVEIETTSICNRSCSYCPNSTETSKSGYLDEEIFYKIIDELASINYDGRLSTHMYGEPLLDKRIYRFINYARQNLPDVFIKFFTNGDKLTRDVINKLGEAGVDVFRVSQHDSVPNEELLLVLDEYKKRNGKHTVEYISYHNNDDDLMNRGGLVDVNHDVKMKYCDYVSGVTVDFHGNMVLCCQDYHSSVKLGNLREEKLIDIWNNNKNKMLRDEIKCGIWKKKLCKACNGIN